MVSHQSPDSSGQTCVNLAAYLTHHRLWPRATPTRERSNPSLKKIVRNIFFRGRNQLLLVQKISLLVDTPCRWFPPSYVCWFSFSCCQSSPSWPIAFTAWKNCHIHSLIDIFCAEYLFGCEMMPLVARHTSAPTGLVVAVDAHLVALAVPSGADLLLEAAAPMLPSPKRCGCW